MYASLKGHNEIVQYLVDHGANLDLQNNVLKCPFLHTGSLCYDFSSLPLFSLIRAHTRTRSHNVSVYAVSMSALLPALLE